MFEKSCHLSKIYTKLHTILVATVFNIVYVMFEFVATETLSKIMTGKIDWVLHKIFLICITLTIINK